MSSKDAQIGLQVRVGKHCSNLSLRGQLGTIRWRYGHPEYAAYEVCLCDGRSELFWYHELEAA